MTENNFKQKVLDQLSALPEDKDKPCFYMNGGQGYTINQIIDEVTRETPTGLNIIEGTRRLEERQAALGISTPAP